MDEICYVNIRFTENKCSMLWEIRAVLNSACPLAPGR